MSVGRFLDSFTLNHPIHDVLDELESILETKYTKVYFYKGIIIKVIKFNKNYTPDWNSPFRGEIARVNISYLLSHVLMFSGPVRSPHICIPVCEPLLDVEFGDRKHVVMFQESAKHMDACNYFLNCRKDGEYFDEQFRLILFQVAYTLGALYKVYPNFRHNDLKATNVLIGDNPYGHSEYTSLEYTYDGMKFIVPNTFGIISMLTDFDLSCVAGVADNFRVHHFWAVQPCLNIGWKKDHKSDIAFFAKTFYAATKNFLSTGFTRSLLSTFGYSYMKEFLTNGNNYLRATPERVSSLPSVQYLLTQSPLFNSFRIPELADCTQIMESFSADYALPEYPKWPLCISERSTLYYNTLQNINLPTKSSIPGLNFFRILPKVEQQQRKGVVRCTDLEKLKDHMKDLHAQGEIFINVSRANYIIDEAFHNVANDPNLDPEYYEAIALCHIWDLIVEQNAYGLTIESSDHENWSIILQNQYSIEELFQLSLYYTWNKIL